MRTRPAFLTRPSAGRRFLLRRQEWGAALLPRDIGRQANSDGVSILAGRVNWFRQPRQRADTVTGYDIGRF